MTRDEENLNLLSIFHYILGGLTALFSSLFLIHMVIGISMLSGAFGSENAPPRIVGWLFVFMPAGIVLAGWALAVLFIVAGRKLKRRTSHTFCLVAAGFECMLMPIGTVLGVFTLVVLMKDSVEELFSAGGAVEKTHP